MIIKGSEALTVLELVVIYNSLAAFGGDVAGRIMVKIFGLINQRQGG